MSKSKAKCLEPMVWVSDHGMYPSVHHFSPADGNGFTYEGVNVKMPNNFGVAFAGLRTADDVIVDLVELRCGDANDAKDAQSLFSRNTTIVITADAKLIGRCQVAQRQSTSNVLFIEPSSLLKQLEVYKLNLHEEKGLFGELSHHNAHHASIDPAKFEEAGGRNGRKTNTMTSFKASTIAMEQHARFQARFQSRGDNKPAASSEQLYTDEDNTDEETTDETEAALAAKLKTEQIRRQLLLSDAFYLARPSKMRGRRSASTMAAIHAKYKDRNISKKQQKRLYEKRFGRSRRNDKRVGINTRKELAEKLQMHLEGLAEAANGEDSVGRCQIASGDSECLLHILLEWFDEEHFETTGIDDSTPHDHLDGLLLEGGYENLELDKSLNPLESILIAPLRNPKSAAQLAPLRLVVISDTHGFENELAKFDQTKPSGEYLLPQADLLIHCGKYETDENVRDLLCVSRPNFLFTHIHIISILPKEILRQTEADTSKKLLLEGLTSFLFHRITSLKLSS